MKIVLETWRSGENLPVKNSDISGFPEQKAENISQGKKTVPPDPDTGKSIVLFGEIKFP